MNLYEQYKKKKFELSAFGIERREGRSDYLCTPKGASVIGWTGVDGIHYCTIKGFREMVFAIEPMADYGRHAFPVAESFEDFLRLLMACGHEAHLEQAHVWSREKYDAFVKENPITKEASEQMRYLQNEYGLAPIDDPYDYLKTIYDGFDYGTIPFKAEYRKLFPEKEIPTASPKAWRVYFSLGGKGIGGEKAGAELTIGKRFSWNDCEWYIPSAYVCAKGLILDIFARADADKVNEFFERWDWIKEYGTPEQAEELQERNPMNLDYGVSAVVNEKSVQSAKALGDAWVKGRIEYQSDLMEEVLDHYGMDPEKCWIWRRISFPWATKTKPAVKRLRLTLAQRPPIVSGDRFRVSEAGQQLRFTHPITNVEHTLTVHEYERETLYFDRQFSGGYLHPDNLVRFSYTVCPELSASQFQITDCRRGDMPRRMETQRPLHDFESAISLIGGADGPTAVITGVPVSSRKLRSACSALTFEPQKQVEWRMTFREKTVEDIHVEWEKGIG